jgi:hypothetical protein
LPEASALITPDAQGQFIFSATNAELHGTGLQLETQGGLPDIGYWNDASEWVSWNALIAKPGTYRVTAMVATLDSDADFVIDFGRQSLPGRPPMTGGWDKFQTLDLGRIQIDQPGKLLVKVRARENASWKPINLNSIELEPTF